MSRKNRTFRLSDDLVETLDAKAGDGGSRATVVEHLVESHDRDMRDAMMVLKVQAKWERPEICAAMDALNGTDLAYPMSRDPRILALDLHDAAKLNDVAGKWGVDADVWAKRVAQVRESVSVAWSLRVLARAFWAGDAWVEKRVLPYEDEADDESERAHQEDPT